MGQAMGRSSAPENSDQVRVNIGGKWATIAVDLEDLLSAALARRGGVLAEFADRLSRRTANATITALALAPEDEDDAIVRVEEELDENPLTVMKLVINDDGTVSWEWGAQPASPRRSGGRKRGRDESPGSRSSHKSPSKKSIKVGGSKKRHGVSGG